MLKEVFEDYDTEDINVVAFVFRSIVGKMYVIYENGVHELYQLKDLRLVAALGIASSDQRSAIKAGLLCHGEFMRTGGILGSLFKNMSSPKGQPTRKSTACQPKL